MGMPKTEPKLYDRDTGEQRPPIQPPLLRQGDDPGQSSPPVDPPPIPWKGPQLVAPDVLVFNSLEQIEYLLNTICPVCPENKRTAATMLAHIRAHRGNRALARPAPKTQVRPAPASVVSPFTEETPPTNNPPQAVSPPVGAPPADAKPGMLGKVVRYTAAKLGPKTDEEVAKMRIDICRHGEVFCLKCNAWADYDQETDRWVCPNEGCDWSVSRDDARREYRGGMGAHPCPYLLQEGRGQFCKQCGCGSRKEADIENKARMENAKCPRYVWPKSAGTNH